MNDHHESQTNENQSTNDNLELFKQALNEARFKIDESIEYTPSRRHKIRMNRIFRENVGGKFLPFPEVDCLYEKIRSRVVIKLKLKGSKGKMNP